jgi:GTP cyclohydrolase I
MSDPGDPISEAVGRILDELGEDGLRDGLQKTPSRVAEALRLFTEGYRTDPLEILSGALFEVEYDEMVLVRDIDFYSLCEHHMVPFFGRVHVAYIPDRKVVGLSKIARLVEVFARRLQVQERLSVQVASTLQEALRPRGVGVVVEARHLCMAMRGVQKQNTWVITSSLRGCFESNSKTRTEFMELIQHQTDSFA